MALKSGYYSASAFKHIQATASDTWVIDHNVGLNNNMAIPVVDVYAIIDSVQTKIIPSNVQRTGSGQVTVFFTRPFSGFALVIA